MSKNYFEIIRAGINTTFQDRGRGNLYHIGIPFSGAMDTRNFFLSNKLVGNKVDFPVIEFAYQGPLLRFNGDKIIIAITGDVIFKLIKKDKEIDGNCYESYQIEHGDKIDILSTNKSVYGYMAISGDLELKFQWGSCSINTNARIGSNPMMLEIPSYESTDIDTPDDWDLGEVMIEYYRKKGVIQ